MNWITIRTLAFCLLIISTCPVQAQLRVLLYHAHVNLGYEETRFIEQMDFLEANDYHTITPKQLLDWMQYETPLPIRPVLLTVDDNYDLVFSSMFPILHTRDQIMVNFTITDSVEGHTTWDYCDWDQLRTMELSGTMPTESHTKTHPHLSSLDASAMWEEIEGSKAAIEENIPGKTCDYLAYPYGDYNSEAMRFCGMTGYRAAFIVKSAVVTPETNRFEIPRYDVSASNLSEMKSALGYDSLPPSPPGEGWTVDNLDPGFFAKDSWQAINGEQSYASNFSLQVAGEESEPARWAVYLPQGGTYRVHAWWPVREDLSSQARYEIHHSRGVLTKTCDQSDQGGQWNLLGQVTFSEDEPAEVFLQSEDSEAVAADGIWFEPGDWQSGILMAY